VTRFLGDLGWTVLRIWHHELDDEAHVLRRCLAALCSGPSTQPAASRSANRY
jgi:very-short-patch-repair endonuclease